MKIETVNMVDCHGLDEAVGVHWSDCEFAQMAENGSYVNLACDNDDIEEIIEDIEWQLGKESLIMDEVHLSSNPYLKRIYNQYKVMKYFRDEHKLTSILIHIHW